MEVPNFLPLKFGNLRSARLTHQTSHTIKRNQVRNARGLRHLLEPAIPRQTVVLVPKRREIPVVVAPRSAILLDAGLHEAQHRTWMSPDFPVLRRSAESVLPRRRVVSPTR